MPVGCAKNGEVLGNFMDQRKLRSSTDPTTSIRRKTDADLGEPRSTGALIPKRLTVGTHAAVWTDGSVLMGSARWTCRDPGRIWGSELFCETARLGSAAALANPAREAPDLPVGVVPGRALVGAVVSWLRARSNCIDLGASRSWVRPGRVAGGGFQGWNPPPLLF